MIGPVRASVGTAFFLQQRETGGYRFALYDAAHGASVRAAVVYVHPFADEMNKSRRMAAIMARRLAAEGLAVLRLDLLGCGDSSGDFRDASWHAWRQDVRMALEWMRERHPGAPLVLWGLRAGCLLALEAAVDFGGDTALLLWQPPLTGRSLLQQFMRLRTVASITGADRHAAVAGAGTAAVMREMRDDWEDGRSVQIAGYEISPALAAGLEGATLDPRPGRFRVAWLETSTRDPSALLPASRGACDRWLAASHDVRAFAVSAPAFWQTVEIEDAPALVEATVQAANWLLQALPLTPPASLPAPAAPAVEVEPGVIEVPHSLLCCSESLPALVTTPSSTPAAGVLIVVGGPQYRVGSHRHFVHLARALARAGYAAMRFDMRGMGDATGDLVDFERCGEDIAAAHQAFAALLPAGTPIAIWGLCDGASAALLHLESIRSGVAGLVLVNPWVRSTQSLAAAHVNHYYGNRLREREFWAKLIRGRVALTALREFWQALRLARSPLADAPAKGFQQRMAANYATYGGPTLLLISEHDITAREFLEFKDRDADWRLAWQRRPPEQVVLPDADHTFSQASARQKAEDATIAWLARSNDRARNAARVRS